MEALLISACLLGRCCKYSGGHNAMSRETIKALKEKYELIPVCPETDGGLPTPRVPSERRGDRVINKEGQDVTAQYRLGAEKALAAAEKNRCAKALFKEKSPSCGSGKIYDGSFTKTLIPGDGVASALLKKHGIEIYGESQADKLI